jgi:hypothetical protein
MQLRSPIFLVVMALLMTPTLVPGAGFEIRDKFGTTTDLAVSHDYKPMPNTAVASAAESVQENAGFFIAISATPAEAVLRSTANDLLDGGKYNRARRFEIHAQVADQILSSDGVPSP